MVETVGGMMALRKNVRAGQPNEPVRIPTMGASETGLRDQPGPEEERGYSWLEDYLVRLDGKEALQGYYLGLE
jgi:hypothetical protein